MQSGSRSLLVPSVSPTLAAMTPVNSTTAVAAAAAAVKPGAPAASDVLGLYLPFHSASSSPISSASFASSAAAATVSPSASPAATVPSTPTATQRQPMLRVPTSMSTSSAPAATASKHTVATGLASTSSNKKKKARDNSNGAADGQQPAKRSRVYVRHAYSPSSNTRERIELHKRGYLPPGESRPITSKPEDVSPSTWSDGAVLLMAEVLQPGFAEMYPRIGRAIREARRLREARVQSNAAAAGGASNVKQPSTSAELMESALRNKMASAKAAVTTSPASPALSSSSARSHGSGNGGDGVPTLAHLISVPDSPSNAAVPQSPLVLSSRAVAMAASVPGTPAAAAAAAAAVPAHQHGSSSSAVGKSLALPAHASAAPSACTSLPLTLTAAVAVPEFEPLSASPMKELDELMQFCLPTEQLSAPPASSLMAADLPPASLPALDDPSDAVMWDSLASATSALDAMWA